MVVISDDTVHGTAFVHRAQREIIDFVESIAPNIQKIIYFSDGAAAHYKNNMNMLNLCLHEQDFGIKARWVFFCHSARKRSVRWIRDCC